MPSQQIPLAEPLVEVERGSITESRHRGHIVAVEPDGNVIASLGAPENVTFLRSSAKPFQALPLLVTGAAERSNAERRARTHDNRRTVRLLHLPTS